MMRATCLVGLIGANIMKSLTPALQEDALAAAGIRGYYHLMDFDRLPGRPCSPRQVTPRMGAIIWFSSVSSAPRVM